MHSEFTIKPLGQFDLKSLAEFGFGQRDQPSFDGVMRLAFCLDDYSTQVGVEVRQDDAGVHASVVGDVNIEAVKRQVSRVLSLDYDGDEFTKVGTRDPIIGKLQQLAPGLRPPLFYSPYEAAAWSIISARRPAQQMAVVRDSISQQYGKIFKLAGQELAAFPTPEQLLQLNEFPGLTSEKIDRLHGVGQAALNGELDVELIKSADPSGSMQRLQSIKGIGPFYSALIVIRASGLADVLPANEPKALELISQLYGLQSLPTEKDLEAISDNWKPFRTWSTVLIRAVGPKLLIDL